MISQPASSNFPCFPLPSGTPRTLGLSILYCCLPTPSSVCLVFFLHSLCLAIWFWSYLINGGHVHITSVCISLLWSGGLRVVKLPAGFCTTWHISPTNCQIFTLAISAFSVHSTSSFQILLKPTVACVLTIDEIFICDIMNCVWPWNELHGWLSVKYLWPTSSARPNGTAWLTVLFIYHIVLCPLLDTHSSRCCFSVVVYWFSAAVYLSVTDWLEPKRGVNYIDRWVDLVIGVTISGGLYIWRCEQSPAQKRLAALACTKSCYNFILIQQRASFEYNYLIRYIISSLRGFRNALPR